MTEDGGYAFDTLAVHAGLAEGGDPAVGAVIPPIYQTSTYVQRGGVGRPVAAYDYARSENPTRTALQDALGALEGGLATSFSSGMAAIHACLSLLDPGDALLLSDDAYGGTFRIVDQVMTRTGLTYATADLTDVDAVAAALDADPRIRLVWAETPTNPLLSVVDITALAGLARDRGALLCVDNTFASPALQRPLALGADLVVHSATKYLGGHSDTIGGVAVTSDPERHARLRFLQNAIGAVPGPFDCFLVHRGLRTLGLRMARHCDNAAQIAAMLAGRDDVVAVHYPGLADDPARRALAERQMVGGFGGMVSFRPVGGRDAAHRIAESTRLFSLAESLGGVESLVEVPAAMTHTSTAGSALEVPADLVRLSVGIEDPADLLDDLARAFARAAA